VTTTNPNPIILIAASGDAGAALYQAARQFTALPPLLTVRGLRGQLVNWLRSAPTEVAATFITGDGPRRRIVGYRVVERLNVAVEQGAVTVGADRPGNQPAARAILGDLPPGVLAEVGVTYLALGRGLTNCSAAEYLQL